MNYINDILKKIKQNEYKNEIQKINNVYYIYDKIDFNTYKIKISCKDLIITIIINYEKELNSISINYNSLNKNDFEIKNLFFSKKKFIISLENDVDNNTVYYGIKRKIYYTPYEKIKLKIIENSGVDIIENIDIENILLIDDYIKINNEIICKSNDELIKNILLHPRNKEVILYTINSISKELIDLKIILENYELYKFLNKNYINDVLTQNIVSKNINNLANLECGQNFQKRIKYTSNK